MYPSPRWKSYVGCEAFHVARGDINNESFTFPGKNGLEVLTNSLNVPVVVEGASRLDYGPRLLDIFVQMACRQFLVDLVFGDLVH